MTMAKAGTARCITFSMAWQGERLCFVFRGTTKQTVRGAIGNMGQFCSGFIVTHENATTVVNGMCFGVVMAIITEPRIDLMPEADWPIIIARFLSRATHREVTYIDNMNKLLNS